ncbi:MAG: hypothetical protein ACKV2U_02770 [Bryobacteraceae bacterium]
MILSLGPRLPILEEVRGLPFSGEWEQWVDALQAAIHGSLARDGAGSTRLEFDQPDGFGNTARIAVICDVSSGEMIFLDVRNEVELGRQSWERSYGVWKFDHPVFTGIVKTIEGEPCELVKFGGPDDPEGSLDPGELWWSRELRIVILDNPTGKEISYRLRAPRRGQPDKNLFRVPTR